jgi:AAA15 family ATPase/GTPase
MDTLKHGRVLFIDEFDARLHPLITHEIIRLFNSTKLNRNNAQLVFATHDTNLLSNKLFRRDQIWFTEKDKFGATHLHSLVEYKIRNDASFEKNYINGKYGAIPFIGNLGDLFGASDGQSS